MLRARSLRRLKMTSIAAVAASAAFAVWSVFATSTDGDAVPLAQESVEEPATGSGPAGLNSGPQTGSALSLANPRSISEQEMIDGTIEDVNRRTQKLMDAGIIPGF